MSYEEKLFYAIVSILIMLFLGLGVVGFAIKLYDIDPATAPYTLGIVCFIGAAFNIAVRLGHMLGSD